MILSLSVFRVYKFTTFKLISKKITEFMIVFNDKESV